MAYTYQVEGGHHPGRMYQDQAGNLHPNGGVIDCSDGPQAAGPVSTIAAAGNAQNNATAVPANAAVVLVTGASGTNGVILPTPTQIGQQVEIVNTNGTNALLIYPDSGGTGGKIANGAANASYSLAAAKGATLVATALSPSQWWSISN